MLGLLTAGLLLSQSQISVEAGGRLLIEAESTPPHGSWRSEVLQAGYSGTGYLIWRGPPRPADGTEALTYRFRVVTPGRYLFYLHSWHGVESPIAHNDIRVRFDRGAWTGMRSEEDGVWTWSSTRPEDGTPNVSVELTAGEHTLQISARDEGLALDRIHLMREGVANPTVLTDPLSTTVPNLTVSPERNRFAKIIFTHLGPPLDEADTENPFTDYALDLVVTRDGQTRTIPGYFAADGDAAVTSATAGTVWRAVFVPEERGTYSYQVRFRRGPSAALSAEGTRVAELNGTLEIVQQAGGGPRSAGFLRTSGRYLTFSREGSNFIKMGVSSPENLLAYDDFDQSTAQHVFGPHVADWRNGDPTWNEAGKGIIGAINYLADAGVNTIAFNVVDVNGTGVVWPFRDPSERLRYDVSKLAQWERVFEHAERRGVALQPVLFEADDATLLDAGAIGPETQLLLRELVARFGHHTRLIWDLGAGVTDPARLAALASALRARDSYRHPVTARAAAGQSTAVYMPLLGQPDGIDGPALATETIAAAIETRQWVDLSIQAERQWAVMIDQVGPAATGAASDAADPGHDALRKEHLYAHLFAGGAGLNWYFGAAEARSLEDFRTRDQLFAQGRRALAVLEGRPLAEMTNVYGFDVPTHYVIARSGAEYLLYLPNGGTTTLDLGTSTTTYAVRWFDPRSDAEPVAGAAVSGPGPVSLGPPPADVGLDWILELRDGASFSSEITSLEIATLEGLVSGQPPLADGSVVNLARLPQDGLRLRATVAPSRVGSVRFELDGDRSTEDSAPYEVARGAFELGSHTLVVTPFSGPEARGTAGRALSIQYQVIDDPNANAPPMVAFDLPEAEAAPVAGKVYEVQLVVSDEDGDAIQHVRLLADGVELATLESPYRYAWIPARAAQYRLRAEALDARGAVGEREETVVVRASGADDQGLPSGRELPEAPLRGCQCLAWGPGPSALWLLLGLGLARSRKRR